jgi:hypothetical protein
MIESLRIHSISYPFTSLGSQREISTMIKDGSLLGSLKVSAPIAPPSDAAAERVANSESPASAASKATPQQSVLPDMHVLASQLRLDPMSLFNGGWPNLQNFLIGLNLTPAGVRTSSNPFVAGLDQDEPAEVVDPETGELLSKSSTPPPQQIHPPITQGSSLLDQDPFSTFSRLDSQG